MTHTLVLLGNDGYAGAAYRQIAGLPNITCVIDRSTSMARVWRLLRRGVLSPRLAARMWWCQFRCAEAPPPASLLTVRSNHDLATHIRQLAPMRVVLYRAGLIINQHVLSLGVPLYNIHCASLPEYAGLGALARARTSGTWQQYACFHHVTRGIDTGAIIAREPFTLHPSSSYCDDERIAYRAGAVLLYRQVSTSVEHE